MESISPKKKKRILKKKMRLKSRSPSKRPEFNHREYRPQDLIILERAARRIQAVFRGSQIRKHAKSISVFGRIRPLSPFESGQKCLVTEGTNIGVKSNIDGSKVKMLEFSHIFGPSALTGNVFHRLVEPMAQNVERGFNAILLIYGATGSGKTHTMKGEPNDPGLLVRTIMHFKSQKFDVSLSALEAYGYKTSKIGIYDLLCSQNMDSKNWKDKVTCLEPEKRARKVCMTHFKTDKIKETINKIFAASHFAPTGSNPRSSRGHIVFIVTVSDQKGERHFALVDLAGSEGISSLDKNFAAKFSFETLNQRRMEAGSINQGLTQLQVMMRELRENGKPTSCRGNGLRRILHNFWTNQTSTSILFTFSSSIDSTKASRATLKISSMARLVKIHIKSAKKFGNDTKAMLISKLESIIENQQAEILSLRAQLQKRRKKRSESPTFNAANEARDIILQIEAQTEPEPEDGGFVHKVRKERRRRLSTLIDQEHLKAIGTCLATMDELQEYASQARNQTLGTIQEKEEKNTISKKEQERHHLKKSAVQFGDTSIREIRQPPIEIHQVKNSFASRCPLKSSVWKRAQKGASKELEIFVETKHHKYQIHIENTETLDEWIRGDGLLLEKADSQSEKKTLRKWLLFAWGMVSLLLLTLIGFSSQIHKENIHRFADHDYYNLTQTAIYEKTIDDLEMRLRLFNGGRCGPRSCKARNHFEQSPVFMSSSNFE